VPRTARGSSAFVRNEDLSLPGFGNEEAAELAAETIPRMDGRRVRVAYRSRTSTYDVVVKDRREIGS
jgi:hypothetical protein